MDQTATTATSVKDAVISGLTTIGNDLTATVTGVLPIALGIVGAVMVIIFGVKIFKKLTGKS